MASVSSCSFFSFSLFYLCFLTPCFSSTLYNRTCNPVSEFTCENKLCIPKLWTCDGENDCDDNSDEQLPSCKKKACGVSSSFACQTRNESSCLHRILFCDGYNNCDDGFDEISQNCPPCKRETDFKCKNKHCIFKSDLCDGNDDCGDNSDEDKGLCSRFCTEEHQFRCKNLECLPLKKRCNGINDCDDNSDEINCEGFDKITKNGVNTKRYYTHTIIGDPEVEKEYWVDINSQKNKGNITRRAQLSFPFPFYGHMIRNLTVHPDGFLDTYRPFLYWPPPSDYISPLCVSLNLRKQSVIEYSDNGTAFTAMWENVSAFDVNDELRGKEFSFQVTLKNNGEIVFVYRKVPYSIDKIQIYKNKPYAQVGLSDSYTNRNDPEGTFFQFRRKNAPIYNYKLNSVEMSSITNGTVIIYKPLSPCMDFKSCNACLALDNDQLKCIWCERTGRCMPGRDRYHQQLAQVECDENGIEWITQCPALPSNSQQVSVSAPNATVTTS